MKALTVQQPWAWAILDGRKRVENRSRCCNYRGPLILHAGKSRIRLGAPMPDGSAAPAESELVFGAILGVVQVVDCLPVHDVDDPFATGPWCWILANPIKISPTPWRGQLGLFDIPDHLLPASVLVAARIMTP